MSYDTKPDDSQNPPIGEVAFKGEGRGYYPCRDSEKTRCNNNICRTSVCREKNWSCEYSKIGIGSWHWSGWKFKATSAFEYSVTLAKEMEKSFLDADVFTTFLPICKVVVICWCICSPLDTCPGSSYISTTFSKSTALSPALYCQWQFVTHLLYVKSQPK